MNFDLIEKRTYNLSKDNSGVKFLSKISKKILKELFFNFQYIYYFNNNFRKTRKKGPINLNIFIKNITIFV